MYMVWAKGRQNSPWRPVAYIVNFNLKIKMTAANLREKFKADAGEILVSNERPILQFSS